MGQRFDGFVGNTEAIDSFADQASVRIRVALTMGFEFVPLTDHLYDSLGDLAGEAEAGQIPLGLGLCAGVVAAIERASRGGLTIAYLNSEFAGGTGLQSGAVWRDGEVVFRSNQGVILRTDSPVPRSSWPCNAALRVLVGDGDPDRDYFMDLGLCKLRDRSEYHEMDPEPTDPFYQ